jgi:hypothetical protein
VTHGAVARVLVPYEETPGRRERGSQSGAGWSGTVTKKVTIMRATLDKLISWAGVLLALVLLIGSGLLFYASSFIGNQVDDQLSAQHITMPTTQTGLADLPKADQSALSQYAGQQMTTGPQAKAYANHFIAVHLGEAAGGKTYSEVSGQYLAQCSDPAKATTAACQKLAGLRQTMFMGTTLRGLLLYGYAFATMGTIAGYAAWVCLVAAVALGILVGFGFWHSHRARAGADATVAAAGTPIGAGA